MKFLSFYLFALTAVMFGIGQYVGHLDAEICQSRMGLSYAQCRARLG